MREVFVNLILNAVDALPRGGRITIKTWAADHRVQCAVSDTGTGMAAESQRRVLEPVFTTKGPKRTGPTASLGLWTAPRLISCSRISGCRECPDGRLLERSRRRIPLSAWGSLRDGATSRTRGLKIEES